MGCSCAEAAGATSCCTPAPCVASAVGIELAERQPLGGCTAGKDLCDTDIVELFGDSDSDKSGAGVGEDGKSMDGSQMKQWGGSGIVEVEWGGAEAEADAEATLLRLSRCSILGLSYTLGTVPAVPPISHTTL